MNKSQLQHDLDCDALIATAKQRRRRQIASVILPTLILGSSLFQWSSRYQPATISPPALASLPQETAPSPEPSKVGLLEIIQSDEELLALLADYGPVLVKNEEGKQSLFITSPPKARESFVELTKLHGERPQTRTCLSEPKNENRS